jgi:hypothetical protein
MVEHSVLVTFSLCVCPGSSSPGRERIGEPANFRRFDAAADFEVIGVELDQPA